MSGPQSETVAAYAGRVEIEGKSLSYSESGAGPPLVLLHGLGGPGTWSNCLSLLSKHFRVILLCLPGFQGSEPPAPRFTADDLANMVSLAMERLHLAPAFVAGTSFGAELGVRIASRNPRQVKKLVLIASTGILPARWFVRNRLLQGAFGLFLRHCILPYEWVLALAGRRAFYDLRNRPCWLVPTFAAELRESHGHDTWIQTLCLASGHDPKFPGLLSALTMPAMIVWGADDRTLPAKQAMEFHRLIKGASLRMYSGCGHSVPLERTDELCESIVTFCLS